MTGQFRRALWTFAGAMLACLSAPLPAQDPVPAAPENLPQEPVTYSSVFKVTAGEDAAITRIIEDIGDKRVVALGEISHGDGSSFLFKARLIERLHRERGFDVLVMEGGIYDHIEAEERIAAGEKPSKAFAQANFAIWTMSEQFAPMLELVDKAAQAGRPFALAGVDFQHSGNYRDENLKRLAAIADRLGDEGEAVRFLIKVWTSLPRAKQGPDSAFNTVIEQLETSRETALAAIDKAGGPDAERDRRLIDNHAQFVRHSALYARLGLEGMGWDEFNIRDTMMGENLNHLATRLYPDRKIVVWGATSHVMRDRAVIDETMPMVPMGHHVDQGPVSGEYYVLAFSALGGRNGTFPNGPYDLAPAEPDGIETYAMLEASGAQTAFVELPPCGQSVARIRALGYRYYTGDWGCAVDGLVVFRDMIPSIYATQSESRSSEKS